jgi:cysteine synthase
MEYPIVKPDGSVYMTVCKEGNQLKIKGIGSEKLSVTFDIKVTDQLLEALQNIKFERFVEGN